MAWSNGVAGSLKVIIIIIYIYIYIYPMWVDDQGIRTKLLDKEILFEFANPLDERSINTLRD